MNPKPETSNLLKSKYQAEGTYGSVNSLKKFLNNQKINKTN